MFKKMFNKKNSRVSGLFIGFSVLMGQAHAASFAVSGGYTFDANMLSNFDLSEGKNSGYGNTASYWGHRFILRPDVLVDDRFTIRSEFNMLHQADEAGVNNVSDAAGSALDASLDIPGGGQVLDVRKVYLEWASDWGLFKIGRQPKDWGLGILYNTGTSVTKVNDTIVDRVGFEGMVGNLHIELGFEKSKEGKLANDADDAESYEIAVEYINDESGFDVGLLYNRTVVMASAGIDLDSEHLLGIYSKKRWGKLHLGGEFVSRNYQDLDPQFGLLAKLMYKPSAWALGVDAGYASATGDGSFAFQSNYKPLMILFNEFVGPAAGENIRTSANIGRAIAGGTGSGATFGVLSGAYTFASGNYTLGSTLGYAQLVKQGTNDGKALGTEFDLHLTQKWYDNFQTSYGLGMLFPGAAFGDGAQLAWGTRITGALKF